MFLIHSYRHNKANRNRKVRNKEKGFRNPPRKETEMKKKELERDKSIDKVSEEVRYHDEKERKKQNRSSTHEFPSEKATESRPTQIWNNSIIRKQTDVKMNNMHNKSDKNKQTDEIKLNIDEVAKVKCYQAEQKSVTVSLNNSVARENEKSTKASLGLALANSRQNARENNLFVKENKAKGEESRNKYENKLDNIIDKDSRASENANHQRNRAKYGSQFWQILSIFIFVLLGLRHTPSVLHHPPCKSKQMQYNNCDGGKYVKVNMFAVLTCSLAYCIRFVEIWFKSCVRATNFRSRQIVIYNIVNLVPWWYWHLAVSGNPPRIGYKRPSEGRRKSECLLHLHCRYEGAARALALPALMLRCFYSLTSFHCTVDRMNCYYKVMLIMGRNQNQPCPLIASWYFNKQVIMTLRVLLLTFHLLPYIYCFYSIISLFLSFSSLLFFLFLVLLLLLSEALERPTRMEGTPEHAPHQGRGWGSHPYTKLALV